MCAWDDSEVILSVIVTAAILEVYAMCSSVAYVVNLSILANSCAWNYTNQIKLSCLFIYVKMHNRE